MSEMRSLPADAFPMDSWRIIEVGFDAERLPRLETIFALSNGYLGLRGNLEEGSPSFAAGTFVNGFHETWDIGYVDKGYGFAAIGQTMLNLPDGKTIQVMVDDEPLQLLEADIMEWARILDMAAGTLTRSLLWRTRTGKEVRIESTRLVSFTHRHLAAIQYTVTVLNADARVAISSLLHNTVDRTGDDSDPRKAHAFSVPPLVRTARNVCETRVTASFSTGHSGMTLACGVDHTLETTNAYTVHTSEDADGVAVEFAIDTAAGVPLTLTKYLGYHDGSGDPTSLLTALSTSLDEAKERGFPQLLTAQRSFIDEFWATSDIEIIDGAGVPPLLRGDLQRAMRWNLFQLLQATARTDGRGVPAKGLTGQAYAGHYFWDTEMYVLPFLTYTRPGTARTLLGFRRTMLDKARQRAAEMHQAGAMFPWRTINGTEASAYFPAGSAQYHINADIMYALREYVEVTGDVEFLASDGTEMLVETARMWFDLGFFSPRQNGRFCINEVTGPDEYTALVDNNLYTNLMAQMNMTFAADTVEWLHSYRPDLHRGLVESTRLEPDETTNWRRAAAQMMVPFDEQAQIYLQDSRFLDRPRWDFAATPPERYPLLLHYHPMTIYRHQVIKQTDIVLATFLFSEFFSTEQRQRIFEYYDPLTTGDSSLSPSIQSIAAADIGDLSKAAAYAGRAVMMDVADIGGNVADGCHVAAAGGAWMAMVNGFAGMRRHKDSVAFRPRLPDAIGGLKFHIAVRDSTIRVSVTPEFATYSLTSGESFSISHWGEEVNLAAHRPVSKAIPADAGHAPNLR